MKFIFTVSKLASFGAVAMLAAGFELAGCAGALAQNNLPPVAAPTSSVAVSTLPMIRTESQQVTDYARGLVAGVSNQRGVSGIIVVVSQDRIDMAEGFGSALSGFEEDTPIAIGSTADLFALIASMQLMQRADIVPEEDIANAIGEPEPRGITFDDLLTQRVPGLGAVIPQVIENTASTFYPDWVAHEIFVPLAMTNSRYDSKNGFLVSPRDIGRFLLALVNDGEVGGGSILMPRTADRMMQTHRSNREALPGWTYGFTEMERNGWHALQRDGTGIFPESRVVIIPEMQIAYFIAVAPAAGPAFWQVLDDTLFDRLALPRSGDVSAGSGPLPDAQAAMAAAGSYRLAVADNDALFVKASRRNIRVEARGSLLHLSGGMEGDVVPAPGEIWRREVGATPVGFAGGVLQVGGYVYAKIPPVLSAGVYLALMGLFSIFTIVFAAVGFFIPSLIGREPSRGRELALGLAGLTAILALMAAVLHATV